MYHYQLDKALLLSLFIMIKISEFISCTNFQEHASMGAYWFLKLNKMKKNNKNKAENFIYA